MSSISAGTTTGTALVSTGDTTGQLDLKINGTTQAVRINTSGAIGVGTSPAFGSSGQVLTSGGSSAAPTWSDLPSSGFNGATTTSSATDITLTNTSTQTQYVAMTAADKFVILPDATTLATEGAPIFAIVNTGQYPFHIKDGGGNIIFYNLFQNETVTLTLIDNSAAIGKWANETGLLQLGVGLPQVSSITAVFSSQREPAVAMLSATEALVFYQPTSSTISVVLATISGTSVSYGTPVSVATGADPSHMKALAFNSTTGIISYYSTSNGYSYLRAVTVSGSTVTVGSATTTSSAAVDTDAFGFMAMLDSTTGFVGYVNNVPTTRAAAFTVSGTTITLGTAVTLSSTDTAFYSATQIASGKVFITYVDSGARKMRVCTNSGTTLTLGTAITVTGFTSAAVDLSTFEKISTDAVSGGYYGLTGTTASVSGTTISTPTEYLIGTGGPYVSSKAKYLSDGLQLALTRITNGYFVCLYKGNSSSAATSISVQRVGILISDNAFSPLDVNGGNKGIAVSVLNGYLVSQIIGVLY